MKNYNSFVTRSFVREKIDLDFSCFSPPHGVASFSSGTPSYLFCSTVRMSLNKLTPARLFAGVIVILLANGWVAPSTARAACGDYPLWLSAGQHAPLPEARQDGLEEHNQPTRPDSKPMPMPHHRAPKPCKGPHCSRDNLPPLTPVSVAPGGPDQWAWMISLHRGGEPQPTWDWLVEGAHYAARHRTNIFHPPRHIFA